MDERGVNLINDSIMIAKEKVVNAGIKLVESGLIARTWGNVSCRISESHFVITPSGRDYLTLTTDDIVMVCIEDLSYTGEVKPSGEKAVHAEIYKARPGTNFVIHTHQENASVISTLGVDEIKTGAEFELLGHKIVCAAYGLPGTKKLQKAVAEALTKTIGNAVVMKNHGAICFGEDTEIAFQTAIQLEQASQQYIEKQFLKTEPSASTEVDAMRRYIKKNFNNQMAIESGRVDHLGVRSERTLKGFAISDSHGNLSHIELEKTDETVTDIMLIHREIYLKNPKINYICHSESPYSVAFSEIGMALMPLVDDFAQIIGTKVKMVSTQPQKIAKALNHSSAVFIYNHGAICTGASKGDAIAVQMILEKNSKAKISGLIFRSSAPLSFLDTHLMRIVYLKKYAKQIDEGRQ